jgi:hypothetical protein
MISRRTFVESLSWGALSAVLWSPSAAVGNTGARKSTASDSAEFDYYVSPEGDPLPVELIAWRARQSGEGALLTWQTASEKGNAGFGVEHQPPHEAPQWTRIAFVEGQGTTNETTRYRHEVSDLRPGAHRFRLRQVDVDGTVEYTDPVSVKQGMTKAVRLTGPAPNPVRTEATISFSVRDEQSVSVYLYDVLGRRVKTLYSGTPPSEKAQTVRLNTSTMAAGTYFVRLVAKHHVKTRRCTVISQ